MKRLATVGLALTGVFAAVFITAAPPARAAPCTLGKSPAKLDVIHRYDIGPYTHGVTWLNPNAWNAQRERLWVQYPGTAWNLVWDNIQDETAGVWWGIFYTPSYRPGDGRYWQIFLWDNTSSPGLCGVGSNIVYN